MIAWFTRNGVAANLLMIVVVVGGIVTLRVIEIQFFPTLKLDRIAVSIPYPGASPEEVEQSLVKPVEDALQGLEGIKHLSSRAAEGGGSVVAELETTAPPAKLKEEIKTRVDAITTFPREAERPIIEQLEFREDVLMVAVHGRADERSLKDLAEEIRNELLRIEGISTVERLGIRDDEITVEVKEETLERYGLTFDEVVGAIRAASFDLPGGTVRTPGGDILLRTKEQRYLAREFEDIVLRADPEGTRLTLGEVATLRDGFVDNLVEARFDGDPAAVVHVFAVGKETPFEVAKLVYDYLDTKRATLPAGIRLTPLADGSFYLKDRLNMMLENGGLGLLLVFGVLALFLRPSLAFFVALGIPVSFMGTILLMPHLGLSINMLTLFAFILVLGIVVDDAIVVGEAVFTEIRERGPGTESALRGAHAVAVPVTFAVLTSVVAFIPLVLVPGIMRAFFASIGLVVMSTLLWSLVQSKLVLPYHLSLVKVRDGGGGLLRAQRAVANGLERFIDRVYRPVLDVCLRDRYVCLAGFVAVLVAVGALVPSGRVRMVEFPPVPTDYIVLNLEVPDGSPASQTRAALDEIRAALLRADAKVVAEGGRSAVDHELTVIGETMQGGSADSAAFMIVEMPKMEKRDLSSIEFARRWREEIGNLVGVRSLQMVDTAAMSVQKPVAFRLIGDDFDALMAATVEIKEAMAEFPGVFGVSDNYSAGKQELRMRVTPAGEQLGVGPVHLAQVRQAFYGAEAQRLVRGREEVKVMVRYPPERRRSLVDLAELRVRVGRAAIPFKQVATVEMGQGFPSILRVDRDRAVDITADADKESVNVREVNRKLSQEIIPEVVAKYPGVEARLEGEAKDNAAIFDSLLVNGILALLIMYATLAIPLRSYIQPAIVMAVIPFGLIGAVLGHWMTGQSLSMLSMFGIFALFGVVVNDSLVLVDYVNRERDSGKTLRQSAWEAGARRFRPILLTSLTTFAGLVPILLEKSLQARILIPMATSLAFGVIFATAITLILVPVLYLVIHDIAGLVRCVLGMDPERE